MPTIKITHKDLTTINTIYNIIDEANMLSLRAKKLVKEVKEK